MENDILENIIRPAPDFLPISPAELAEGEAADFVLITGDAYVDHPSFGAIIIGKLLWAAGYSVGIIAMPDYKSAGDFRVFGKPRLGFLVTSGCVDSMVNNYSVAKKKRSVDEYAEGGAYGARPDRAVCVYCRRLREIFGKSVPIIIGGLEASLRRLSHYDYWSDSYRKPILLDSGADICVYGMGERAILEIAALLNAGVLVNDILYVGGTVVKAAADKPNWDESAVKLPNCDEIRAEKKLYAQSFKTQYLNGDHISGKTLYEVYTDSRKNRSIVAQNPSARPLNRDEFDAVYGINFARAQHPSYKKPVPSIAEVKFSVTANRGCFGGCNFCSLTFHQGKIVSGRSKDSIIEEIVAITHMPDFKGYIHDLGGPTANFHAAACDRQLTKGACTGKSCLACENLIKDRREYTELLIAARGVPGVKKVFVRSGVRYDFAIMGGNGQSFIEELCGHHISGQLKVAPEHVSANVLRYMNKPRKEVYEAFTARYKAINERLGKEQYLVPYFISSHPGSGLKEAIELAEYMRDNNINPKQVQDFYPTPGTASTVMFATGINPFDGKAVYVCRDRREKAMQRALMQYKLPQNRALVIEALIKAGRKDLIGRGKRCLTGFPTD